MRVAIVILAGLVTGTPLNTPVERDAVNIAARNAQPEPRYHDNVERDPLAAAFNPQPDPPGDRKRAAEAEAQAEAFNPQPDPPGVHD